MAAPTLRILHCLQPQADFETRQSVRQLSQSLGPEYLCDSLVLRGSGAASLAHAIGQLRRRRQEFDLLHVWSPFALAAAVMGWVGGGPMVYSPPPVMSRRAIRWLRAVMAYRPIQIVCGSAHQQARLIRRGVPPEQCQLIRPGVDFSQLRRRRDPELRRRLRLEPAHFVLLLAGESTATANHFEGLWAAGILRVIDPNYKVVVPGQGALAQRLRQISPSLAGAATARFADEAAGGAVDFGQLFPAVDLVLVSAQGSVRTLPIAWAMAAGLPIVGTAGPVVSELLEDHHTALLTTTPDPRQIAHRVLMFREDPALQWTLSDRARAEAYDYFSQSRFLEEYRRMYQAVCRS